MKVFKLGDEDDKIDTTQYITKSQADKRYVNEGENIDAATLKFNQSLNMDGKQIKNVADGTDDNDACTLKQARSMINEVKELCSVPTRTVILDTKIIGSNKYLYYILKTFPETEYVHILPPLLIKSPADNRYHELRKTPEMGFITVYTMEKLHDIHPHLSIEAEKSHVDPVNGLETSQFLNKDGIIFYCEKTPSVSLRTYYITENNINWIHLRVVYLTCQLNEQSLSPN